MDLRNIHPEAKIGKNVTIEPFATIEKDVVIGDNTWIGPNACIMNGARIGNNCQIHPGAVVSGTPQDLKFEGEESTLEIGDNTIVREFCTLNRGTKANGTTKIGSNCLLMAYVHIAHDCEIGDHCVLANNATLAGHIIVGNWVTIGGKVAIHQFVKIGDHVMIGGGSLVRKDIPPYVKAAREPLSYVGVNSIGLKRRGFSADQIHRMQDIYRLLFVHGKNYNSALEVIREEVETSDEKERILHFLEQSERGVLKGFTARK